MRPIEGASHAPGSRVALPGLCPGNLLRLPAGALHRKRGHSWQGFLCARQGRVARTGRWQGWQKRLTIWRACPEAGDAHHGHARPSSRPRGTAPFRRSCLPIVPRLALNEQVLAVGIAVGQFGYRLQQPVRRARRGPHCLFPLMPVQRRHVVSSLVLGAC